MTAPVSTARRFTVEDANRTLPLVRLVVRDIVDLYADLHRRRERLVALRNRRGRPQRSPSDPYEAEVIQMETDVERDVERPQQFSDELTRIGAQLRDPAVGAVDFPAELDGRDSRLCWRLGEPEVAHWHDAEQTCDARLPLLEAAGIGADDDGLSTEL